jgi:1-acyl-sn-glycerol-3-phosphate acyltransferase
VTELPPRWPWLFRGFRKYAVKYVRRHFHAVRLSKGSAAAPADGPLLVVLNHPSWWDPLICFVLSQELDPRTHWGAIDAAAVGKYRFFTRVGFIGVDQHSLRGAAEFLETGAALLARPDTALWVTAQGRFTDVRTRPLGLRGGVGHLAGRMERGYVLPIALEYTFWTERTPEALVRVGPPLRVADHPKQSGKAWTQAIEAALTDSLDGLNREAMARDPGLFSNLLDGRAGVGGVYDVWRRAKAWATGRRFDPSHGGGDKP